MRSRPTQRKSKARACVSPGAMASELPSRTNMKSSSYVSKKSSNTSVMLCAVGCSKTARAKGQGFRRRRLQRAGRALPAASCGAMMKVQLLSGA